MLDLQKVHQQVLEIITQSNKILTDEYHNVDLVINKTSYKEGVQLSTSVVTKTDVEVEEFLINKLKKLFPEIGFVLEEGDNSELKDYNWFIDPIDGTLNFANHIPLFGTSIALWKKNEPVYGLTTFPLLNETIYAIKNNGLYLNNKQYQPFYPARKKPYILYGHVGTNEEKIESITKLSSVVPFPRYFGSSVYHGSLVALDRVDLAIFFNTGLWDIGAIVLLNREAGFAVEYITPKPDIFAGDLKSYKHSVVMGKKEIVDKIVKEFRKEI